jgi:hypothetical protein
MPSPGFDPRIVCPYTGKSQNGNGSKRKEGAEKRTKEERMKHKIVNVEKKWGQYKGKLSEE